MISRRGLLASTPAALVLAPAIVRIASLMPVHSLGLPIGPQYYGFVERLFIHLKLPPIVELKGAGLSLEGIAAELNRRGVGALNGNPWDTRYVKSVLRKDELIRTSDAIRSAKELLIGM